MIQRRVLIVATWYPTRESPVNGVFVQAQVRALARRYSVAVIAPDFRPLRIVARTGIGLRLKLDFDAETGAPIMRPRVLALIPHRPSHGLDQYVRAVGSAYRRLLVSWGRPDIIHAHVVLAGGYAAARLGEEIGVPVVLTEHSGSFAMDVRVPWIHEKARWALRSVDRRIAVSPSLKDEIEAFEPAHVEVLGNVIDTDFFTAADSGAPIAPHLARFAFVGLLTSVKGVDVLLRAGRVLLDAGVTQWALRIGGDGPRRIDLARMCREFGLSDHVEFLGLLDRPGVRDLYRWTDYAVFPSRRETFGVAAAEAMSTGIAVIGTHSGGLEFVVEGDCGVLVPPDDPKALARAMEQAINGGFSFDPSSIRRSVIRRFGQEAFLAATSKVYESLWA